MGWSAGTRWNRNLGPLVVVLLVVAQGALWFLVRPSAGLSASYVGQGLGALSVLLLSIGLVLVSAEAIRLLHWQAGWVEQPERSLYELEPGQWRDYDAYVGHPGRTPDGMHVGTFDQRVDESRDRFLTEAATAIGQRGGEFGWHRLLLAGDKPVIR